MALPLLEIQQWFPDWERSDSEDSVRSTVDEVADYPADEEAFANLPLPAHYAKHFAVFQEVLHDTATVTLPVMRRDVIGGGAQKVSLKPARREGFQRWGRGRSKTDHEADSIRNGLSHAAPRRLSELSNH
jgi:hypothetical protein